MYGPILLFIVLVHELARAIVTFKLGGTIDTIVLWPLGGLTIYGPEDQGARGDLKVALAGPLIHLPMAGLFALLYVLLKGKDMVGLASRTVFIADLNTGFVGMFLTACRIACWWNLWLCALHLVLPIYPLDGIRVWAGVLRSRGMSLTKSAKVTSVGGMGLSLVIFVYGVVKLFDSRIEGGITEILLGGFGFATSKILYDFVKTGRLSEDPIFGRSCYSENGSSVEIPTTGSTGEQGTGSTGEFPIQTVDSAEII